MTEPNSSAANSSNLPWFALQVRCRREAYVASQLEGQGYECFLPSYKSVRRWSDRTKELEQPLFPGYLFSRFDFQNRRPLLTTPGVRLIVGFGSNPTPVEESELAAIRQALTSGLPNQPWPFIQVGQKVRVNYGSFQNLEGILIHFKGVHRVVLSVSLLQRSVAMEIDLAWVTPIGAVNKPAAKRLLVGHALPVPAR